MYICVERTQWHDKTIEANCRAYKALRRGTAVYFLHGVADLSGADGFLYPLISTALASCKIAD